MAGITVKPIEELGQQLVQLPRFYKHTLRLTSQTLARTLTCTTFSYIFFSVVAALHPAPMSQETVEEKWSFWVGFKRFLDNVTLGNHVEIDGEFSYKGILTCC
jgi:hypothetical protein